MSTTVQNMAEAMWLSDGYDLNGDPESSTARELKPEYLRRAQAAIGVVVGEIQELVSHVEHRKNTEGDRHKMKQYAIEDFNFVIDVINGVYDAK